MSRTVDYVVIFAVGLTAGVLGTKWYWKGTYESRYKEDLESVKAAFHEEKKEVVKQNMVAEEEAEQIIREYSKDREDEAPTDYHKFYVKTERVEEEMAKKEFPREESRPRIISEEEYSNTEETFDKMSCTFYVPDKIVVDDVSREVVEPDVIGEENIQYMLETDEKFIYVRNEKIGCDMEISKDESSVVETGDLVWRG